MKSGLTLFLLIMFCLCVMAYGVNMAIDHYVKKYDCVIGVDNKRSDFHGGKQRVLHSGHNAYLGNHAPQQAAPQRQLGVDEHEKAWLNHWAKKEGHPPLR